VKGHHITPIGFRSFYEKNTQNGSEEEPQKKCPFLTCPEGGDQIEQREIGGAVSVNVFHLEVVGKKKIQKIDTRQRNEKEKEIIYLLSVLLVLAFILCAQEEKRQGK